MYEDIVPAVLAHVATGADLVADILSQLERTADGPAPETVARIERERRNATNQYLLDRDTASLTRKMGLLDAEMERAQSTHEDLPTTGDARRYLADLPAFWAAADAESKQMLARAVFDHFDVLGVEQVTVHPTKEALDHSWFEAWRGKTRTVDRST